MSQLSAILEVLKDGRPHSVAEIHRRAGTSRLNSRVSDLRKAGHVIECSTVKGRTNAERYVYRLHDSVGADGATDAGGGVPAGSLGSSAAPLPDSVSPPAVATPKAYAEPPELPPSPMHSAGAPPQLSLLTDAA